MFSSNKSNRKNGVKEVAHNQHEYPIGWKNVDDTHYATKELHEYITTGKSPTNHSLHRSGMYPARGSHPKGFVLLGEYYVSPEAKALAEDYKKKHTL